MNIDRITIYKKLIKLIEENFTKEEIIELFHAYDGDEFDFYDRLIELTYKVAPEHFEHASKMLLSDE